MSEPKQQPAPVPAPKKKPAYLQYAFGGSAGLVYSYFNSCQSRFYFKFGWEQIFRLSLHRAVNLRFVIAASLRLNICVNILSIYVISCTLNPSRLSNFIPTKWRHRDASKIKNKISKSLLWSDSKSKVSPKIFFGRKTLAWEQQSACVDQSLLFRAWLYVQPCQTS